MPGDGPICPPPPFQLELTLLPNSWLSFKKLEDQKCCSISKNNKNAKGVLCQVKLSNFCKKLNFLGLCSIPGGRYNSWKPIPFLRSE